MLRFAFLCLLVLCLCAQALAQLYSYEVELSVQRDGMTEAKLTLSLKRDSGFFWLDLLVPIEGLRISTQANVSCEVQENGVAFIRCEFSRAKGVPITFEFKTRGFVKQLAEGYYFYADLTFFEPIERLKASLRLPEGAVLKRVDLLQNASLSTDGRSIIVNWEYKNLPAQWPLKFKLLYDQPLPQTSLPTWLFLLPIPFLACLLWLWFKRRQVVLSVLNPDERRVVEALLKQGGSMKQKKLVEVTGMSKVKVSRLVRNLAERGIIWIEKLGRNNRLTLKQKF